MSTARVVIGAPASGSGKTTVATGLLAALRRRGTAVAPFKVGPDYVDPGYHALAAGRPGRNLDPVLVGERRVRPLFAHGAAGAEVAVVEGVMGLFDGRSCGPPGFGATGFGPTGFGSTGFGPTGFGSTGFGSTAHVARLLDAPVLLVVDAGGQGRSLAALLHGFASFDPGLRLAGVVLNQVGSARHEQALREACREVGLDVLGALPRRDALAVPSRHLGLLTAAESGPAAHAVVDAMAGLVAGHVDLDAVVRLAAAAPPLTGPPWDAGAEVRAEVGDPVAPGRPVVAVVGGRAFSFGYAEHTELLAAAGAEVAVLDPLADDALPAGTCGLVLPGGFPEEHAGALSANAPLRRAVATLAAAGAPVHAECGGLLYLARELDDHPMCGVLPASATMTGTLTLGYRDAVAVSASALHPAGERVTGHEFHRTTVTPRHAERPAWRWRDATPEGFVHSGVHASFLHTHPAGCPAAVARFVARCAA